jgi:hypothetical protein
MGLALEVFVRKLGRRLGLLLSVGDEECDVCWGELVGTKKGVHLHVM